MAVPNALRSLTAVCLVITVVVVLLGAFTRLVDAGLGCPDWPTCYGHLWVPQTAAEIERANITFQGTPVEVDKTWPEQIHRIFASSLGLLIIALVVLCATRSKISKQPLKLSILLLGLVILQGMFGMWTVTLKLWPQVVTAHLLGGFCTLSLLWLMWLRLQPTRWRGDTPSENMLPLKRGQVLAAIALVIVVAQIALGGWTSSNYAALACPDIPTCQNQWWPNANFSEGFNIWQTIGPNYLGGMLESSARTAIHFSHRIGAVITAAVIILLAWRLWRLPVVLESAQVRVWAQRWSAILLLVLAAQISLGISNVYWQLPLPVAVAHNAIGALLLLVVVTINYQLFALCSIKNVND